MEVLDKINSFKLPQTQEKEHIDELTAQKALVIIDTISISNIADCFIAFSALNLLNSYVKQKNTKPLKIGYAFKRMIDVFVKIVIDKNIDGIKLGHDTTSSAIIIQFKDFQFSFHMKNNTIKEHIEWNNIKKQPIAYSIFNFALSLLSESSDKTIFNDKLSTNINLQKQINNDLFTGE